MHPPPDKGSAERKTVFPRGVGTATRRLFISDLRGQLLNTHCAFEWFVWSLHKDTVVKTALAYKQHSVVIGPVARFLYPVVPHARSFF